TSPSSTVMFEAPRRMWRSGAAMSVAERPAVATWYSSGWKTWWFRRSSSVTRAGAPARAWAAVRPPKPPPTITTCGGTRRFYRRGPGPGSRGILRPMPVIESHVDSAAAEFRENRAHMDGLVADLRERLARAAMGGGEEAARRQREQGKLPVRERVDLLLDRGTPFLEIGALAASGMYDDAAPGAGMVTGIGRVSGREVMVVANDPTVKEHLRAQEIAQENGLPCVYLVDSGGAFLPLQAEVFPDRDHFGRIFYNE